MLYLFTGKLGQFDHTWSGKKAAQAKQQIQALIHQ